MTITDFYRKSKICISKWTSELLEPATIVVHSNGAELETETFFSIPKGFRVEQYFLGEEFGSKSDEANLLRTYLLKSKEFIKKDRGISEITFNFYLAQLNLVLIKNYFKGKRINRVFRLLGAYIKLWLISVLNDSLYNSILCLLKRIERLDECISRGVIE